MKFINLSEILKQAKINPNDKDLSIVIDFHAKFSFRNNLEEDYPGFSVYIPGYFDEKINDSNIIVEFPNGATEEGIVCCPQVCIFENEFDDREVIEIKQAGLPMDKLMGDLENDKL